MRRMRSHTSCFILACLVASTLYISQPTYAQDTNVFKTYYVTGDFASAGAGIRGRGVLDPATGKRLASATLTIPPCPKTAKDPGGFAAAAVSSCIPTDANGHYNVDILGAFVYWASIEKTGEQSGAVGYVANYLAENDATNPNSHAPHCDQGTDPRCIIVGKPLGSPHAAPCWSNGGSTGASQGTITVRNYREDVTKFLAVDTRDPVTNPNGTNKKIPRIRIWLPDLGGNGSSFPLTEGVSLWVLWRHPSMSYKGVILVDGSFTFNNATDLLETKFNQFYQVPLAQKDVTGKVSFGFGDGQSNFPEVVSFASNTGPGTPLGAYTQLKQWGDAPFVGSATPDGLYNPAGGNKWDDLTFDVSGLVKAGATQVATKLSHNTSSFDCLSFGYISASFALQDKDADGLLDAWETYGLTDPKTGSVGDNPPPNVLVPLNLMGANPAVPDIYVEIDYMAQLVKNPATNVVTIVHSEKPTIDSVRLVGDAFARQGIRAHFDMGACPYGVDLNNNCVYDPEGYILKTGQLEGGDVINEKSPSFYCTESDVAKCPFPNQPGFLFWKKGISHIKQAHVPIDPSQTAYSAANLSSKLYQSPYRSFIEHYVVFAHSQAIKAQDENGNLIRCNPNAASGTCDVPQGGGGSAFLLSTVSGRGDLFGNTLSITLGGWKTRNKISEAGTLIHELGHNLGLFHGGTASGANCVSTHTTSMSYAYQNGGLLRADGTVAVDFSPEALPPPFGNENSLNDAAGLGGAAPLNYRLRWYAPRAAVAKYLNVPVSSIRLPRTHCDGSLVNSNIVQGNPKELVRVDGFNISRTNIDWNYDGFTSTNSVLQDIDFNGNYETGADFTNHFTGINDWALVAANQGLRQVGVGRGLLGQAAGVTINDLAQASEINPAQFNGDLEFGDLEFGDLEFGDLEFGDLEFGDLEFGDLEFGDLEFGEPETGGSGLGDLEFGASDEIDEPGTIDIGLNLPPTSLTAKVVKSQGVFGVSLSWTKPTTGTILGYYIYRSDGYTVGPPPFYQVQVGPATQPDGQTVVYLDETVGNNKPYTYFVVAVYDVEVANADGTSTHTTEVGGASNAFPILAK